MMRKNWLNRLLFSYLSIFFIITTVLILIFFLFVSELSKQQAQKAKEIYVHLVIDTIDFSLRSIDQYIIQTVMNDPSVKDFFSQHPLGNKYLNDRVVAQKISNEIRNNELIDSIYFVRNADQIVLNDNEMIPVADYEDHDFIELCSKGDFSFNWTGIRNYKATELLGVGETRSVVSLVKRMPLPRGSEGVVVVNVRVASLQKIIERMSTTNINAISLFDTQGHLLVGDEHDTPNGSLTVVDSPYTGWKIVGGFVHAEWFAFFSTLNYIWIIMGVVTIVIGVVWITYASLKNYKPLEVIISRVRTSPLYKHALPDKQANNEFQIIEHWLDNLVEQTSEYRKQNEENLTFRRQHFFEVLLEGHRSVGQNEWESEMRLFGMPSHFTQLLVVVLEIDKHVEFQETYNHKDQHLLSYIVNCVVKETAQNDGISVWMEWIDHHRLGVLYRYTCELSDTYAQIVASSEKSRKWIEDYLAFTVTIGIGPVVTQLNSICESYKGAIEAINQKSILGSNQIIQRQYIEEEPKVEMFIYLQYIRSISQFFRMGQEEWKLQHEEFFASMHENRVPRDQIVILLNNLIYNFYREMSGFSADYAECWFKHAFPRLNDLVNRFDTLAETKIAFYEVLLETADRMNRIRETRSTHQMLLSIKKYIDDKYADPDFSLSALSDQNNLTPNYLSRIFKEEFGEKYVDYLAQVRIMHAKELLVETSESIQDIAHKVGYLHSFSFIRLFKKLEGVTPGDYRKQLQE